MKAWRPRASIWRETIAADEGLSCPEAFVLTILASYGCMRKAGWPSIGTLCRDTHLCERAVRTALRSLEAKGWIKTDRAPKGQKQRSNRYRITVPPAVREAAEEHSQQRARERLAREARRKAREMPGGQPWNDGYIAPADG